MVYVSHDQTIHAIKSEFPSLIHGKDFWVGQPVKQNSDEYLGDAVIAAWNTEDIEQPDELALQALIEKYQTAWDALPKDAPPSSISRRQFFQQLAVMNIITNQDAIAAMQSGAIPSPLQAIIDDLPTDNAKFEATMLIIGADSFQISHPLTEVVRLKMEWTEEQRNNFFRDAAKL
nr:hypothetical protein [Brucella anthropi]